MPVERTGTFSLGQTELEVVMDFRQGRDLYSRDKVKVMPPDSDPPSRSAQNSGDVALTAPF